MKINNDGVHVLVDLDGWLLIHRNRVLALQPAPVQMHLYGYPGTIGKNHPFLLLLLSLSVCPQLFALN